MNGKLLALCISAILFYGCEKEEDLLVSDKTTSQMVGENCDVISFEGYSGYISSVNSAGGFGPIAVHGTAITPGDTEAPGNRAMIFNSQAPTGDDDDLGTVDWGNILIVQQLDYEAAPNDNWSGAELTLTFPQPVTLESMRVIDVDNGSPRDGGDSNHPLEDESYVYLYVAGNATPIAIYLEPNGDNAGYTVDLLGTQNVVKMVVDFDGEGAVGSGGIDQIRFCVPEEVTGCTKTQGYWKTHSGIDNGKGNGNGKGKTKYDATWDDYLNSTLDRLGSTTYPNLLWMAPQGGNADLILAHQFIAAELNVAAGASIPGNVLAVWLEAQAYFAGDREASRSELIAWAEILDDYNNGIYGPGHCED